MPVGPDNTHVAIPIPYNLFVRDLVIEPTTGDDADLRTTLEHLLSLMDDSPWLGDHEDEIARIFRAATLLFYGDAGTFAQCIGTAITWERG